jgi:hypothetical protein
MTLKGEWTEELINALNRFAQNVWAQWDYDITPDEFSPGETCVTFSANGRWNFESSLKDLGENSLHSSWDMVNWLGYKEASTDYWLLVKTMEHNNLGIELDFTDEESGFQVLYAQKGVITVKAGQFVYTILTNTEYKYTWENYFNLVDEDRGSFIELIDSLYKVAKVNPDDAEKHAEIDKWAMENTCPHNADFDDLNKETQVVFLAAFKAA